MRMNWKIHTKNDRTFYKPDVATCPFAIEVSLTKGKHKVLDTRLYSNGGSTNYQIIGESYNIVGAQNILRNAIKSEQTNATT